MGLSEKQAKMVALALAGEQLIGRGLAYTNDRWTKQVVDLRLVLARLDGWASSYFMLSLHEALQRQETDEETILRSFLQELVNLLDEFSLPGYHFTRQNGWWGWWQKGDARR